MTAGSDVKSLYGRLREHYTADGIHALPQRKEVLQILELRYTPEEAELALSIPVIGQGRVSLEALVEKTGEKEAEVQNKLDSLLFKGVLYMERKRDDGREVYCLWEFLYSMATPLFGDGLVDDTKRKVTELRDKMWDAGSSYLQYPSTHPYSRVMPYEPTLDPAVEVAPYEKYSHYVNNARSICVVACGCRMSVDHCKLPVYVCIHFDRQAEYWIKYRRGRELTKEEALELIEDSVRKGLVVNGTNDQEMPLAFCLCCRDCCEILRPFIENFNTNAFARSNFIPHWDLTKCNACNACQKACPVGAIGRHLSHIEGERDHMIVMPDRCIGCGVCSAVCPQGAITLKRVRDIVPLPTRKEVVGRHAVERVW
jgi:Fe-S-cluster-containing hydrogenase component 2